MIKTIRLLIVLFFVVCSNLTAIDTSRYRFYTLKSTPYYNGINSIVKDSIGRLWYTGSDVLFVYDGYTFTQMNSSITAHSKDSFWKFKELFTDCQQHLFFTTNNGLFNLDYSTMQFEKLLEGDIISITQAEENSIWVAYDNKIEIFSFNSGIEKKSYPFTELSKWSYIKSVRGILYVSTVNGKLYKLNQKKSQFELFADIGIESGPIKQIQEYKDEIFVLTENNGLFRFDQSGKILKYHTLSYNTHGSSIAKKLFLDPTGILWVGTQSGIFLIDPEKDKTVLIQTNLNNEYSLPVNSVWTIYPDPDGGVWLGTYGGKLAYMSFNDNRVDFKHVTKGALNNPIVSCFEEDQEGNIWIGTEGGGVNFWNRSTDDFSYLSQQETEIFKSNLVKSLKFDSAKNKLYIALYRGGLLSYDYNRAIFGDFNLKSIQNQALSMNIYDYLLEGETGIWFSDPDVGFYYKNLKTGDTQRIRLIDFSDNKEFFLNITGLARKKEDELFIFSKQGLFIFNTEKKVITRSYHISDGTFSTDDLSCFLQSSSSELWVGTIGGGVNLLDKNGNYKNYNSNNGFYAKSVFGILEDKFTSEIWFSTDDGLYCFNSINEEFRKADILDPMICGSFYPKSCFLSSKGEMFFGGTNGFIYFNPQNIRINHHKPKVFLTDFLIHNKKVNSLDKKSPLRKDISVMTVDTNNNTNNVIILSYKQNNIGISFSSDSYLRSNKNQFSCRLVGLSNDWQLLPIGQHSIQYSSLSPGTYRFEVKACNNDGIWGDQVSYLHLVVKPAPWLSTFALILYFVLILSTVYFLLKYFSNKKEFKYRLQLEKIEKQRLNELSQIRTNFFTNISHDLKTPLTLILDPLRQLEKTLQNDHNGKSYILLIEKNVKRIQYMINQLLEFRKIESQKIKIDNQSGDIIYFINEIFRLFVPYAKNNNISTFSDFHTQNLSVLFDYNLIEKIFSNLFSNAVKYTPEGELICLRVYQSLESEIQMCNHSAGLPENLVYISFEIINTGAEITEVQEKFLFEAFSRLSTNNTTFQESTGLGLSITKQFVEALGGSIQADIRQEEITFRVVIPFQKCNLKPSDQDYTNKHIDSGYKYVLAELDMIDKNNPVSHKKIDIKENRDKIVIIEDDNSLRTYLEKELSIHFKVFLAENGVEGINLIGKINPHIVITDLMMPELGGLEVCKRLKKNLKTSHIPIIMLSAMDDTVNRTEGLKEGADVFIEKPFDMDHLIQQIKTLIKSRENLKELYSNKFSIEPTQLKISSVDEEFFKKAVSFIENNIQNPDYDVERFVSDMSISRTLLYRKINEATGMSIKEFILDMRLKRAAQLLRDSDYTISEIATMVGFNESKYFSTWFKKHYNQTPSEFKSKEKLNTPKNETT